MILISFNSYSQEFKMKRKTLISGIIEEYNVFKTNDKIKQGDYKLIYRNAIMIKGFYNNDKRDSIWIFYNDSHDTILVYDYREDKVLNFKCQDIFQNCKDKKSPAFYSYGFCTILQNFSLKMKYPDHAAENGLQGTAFVNVLIDANGKVINTFLKNGTGYHDLDKEAIRVVN